MSYIYKLLIILLVLAIGFINLPIAGVAMAYLLFSEMLIAEAFILDAIAIVIVLFLSWWHFDVHVLSALSKSFAVYKANGLMTWFSYQISNMKDMYKSGFVWMLLIPLMLRGIYNYKEYISNRTTTKTLDTKRKEEQVLSLANGTIIGDSGGQEVNVSDKEMNQHCLVIGTTGAGKTTTILNFVEGCAKRNLPCIYLDGKGSVDLIDKMKAMADKYGRKFKVFSLRPDMNLAETAYYNPLSSGDATEWKNRIMSLFAEVQGKGQEHFSLAEQNYINFVANALHGLAYQEKQTIDLKILLTFLENPELLVKAARKTDEKLAQKLEALHGDNTTATMSGDVIKLLELFMYSTYGKLFDTSGQSNVIDLKESILNNELILFLFDASAYGEDTKKIAKMVINDINSSFAGFKQFTKAYCIFDEFASYASSNLAESLSLQRSKGMHAIVGTQGITSIKLKSQDTKRVAEELIACCNTYIIQTINHSEDAEIFAELIGKEDRLDYSRTHYDKERNDGLLEEERARAIGSSRMVEKYVVSPQEIKKLKQGEAIVYRKAANKSPSKIRIKNIL